MREIILKGVIPVGDSQTELFEASSQDTLIKGQKF